MAQQRHTAHQIHDPFIALSNYHLQRLEGRVEKHLAAQVHGTEPGRTIVTVAREWWMWLRRRGPASLRSQRRRVA